jgi:hypothetical protein
MMLVRAGWKISVLAETPNRAAPAGESHGFVRSDCTEATPHPASRPLKKMKLTQSKRNRLNKRIMMSRTLTRSPRIQQARNLRCPSPRKITRPDSETHLGELVCEDDAPSGHGLERESPQPWRPTEIELAARGGSDTHMRNELWLLILFLVLLAVPLFAQDRFIDYNMKKGWCLLTAPILSADWGATSNNVSQAGCNRSNRRSECSGDL